MKETHYPESEALAEMVFPLSNALAKLAHADLRQKITRQQIRIVIGIYLKGGPVRLSKLLEYNAVSQGTMTVAVQKLIKLGLLLKKKDPTDERALCLSLSKKGEALAISIKAQIKMNIDQLFDGLREEDRKAFLKGFEFLRNTLHEFEKSKSNSQ